jgi:hypothetical protein
MYVCSIAGGNGRHITYQISTLIYFRLAFRQSDLFGYFKELGTANKLPPFEDLEGMARKLYRAYTSSRAQYRAIHDTEGQSEWSQIVPLGTPWTGPVAEESSIDIGITAKTSKLPKSSKPVTPQESSAVLGLSVKQSKRSQKQQSKTTTKDDKAEDFKGDRVLARSIALMRNLIWSRECAYAVAEGDAGRVYEILKVKLTL